MSSMSSVGQRHRLSGDVPTSLKIGNNGLKKAGRFSGISRWMTRSLSSPTSSSSSSSSSNHLYGAGTGNVLAPCLMYSFCSVSMVLANKGIAISFKGPASSGAEEGGEGGGKPADDHALDLLVVAYQCMVAVMLVKAAQRLGKAECDAFRLDTALRWLPVNALFILMLFSSFMALKYMNVPMVTVFKNLTNIIITFGDWYLNKQSISKLIFASLTVMTVGACMATAKDVYFSFWGYFWMIANCVFTAGYVLAMKFATKTIKLNRFSMVYYNNLLSVMLLVPLAWYRGEFSAVMIDPKVRSIPYVVLNTFAGCAGFFLNYASLWCIAATSATTYSIIGSVNKVPTSVLGYIMFRTPITKETAIYIAVSIMGGFMYSYAKTMEGNDVKQRQLPLPVAVTEEGKALLNGQRHGSSTGV